MGATRFVNRFIEPNPNCPDGCSQRFQATTPSRPVRLIRYSPGGDETILCDVSGWSSAGGGAACAARAVRVEDSGAGSATLIYGGDWGLRLAPRDGRESFGEPYLLIDDEAIVE